MQNDPTQYKEAFSVGQIILAVGGVIGLGNLLNSAFQRYFVARDRKAAVHETNEERQLDYDEKFLTKLLHRVESLESELEVMRKEQLQQAKDNMRLELQNEHLKQENQRLECEITALQTNAKQRLDRIQHLEAQVTELTAKVEALSK
jgi:predicted RNase H-like nuclease (RuvC/YqgF family)